MELGLFFFAVFLLLTTILRMLEDGNDRSSIIIRGFFCLAWIWIAFEALKMYLAK